MKTISLFNSNEDLELKNFAGGECHLRFLKQFGANDRVRIQTRLNSSDDLMRLCLAVDALRHMGVNYLELFMPYVPYARQDRVMSPGEPLSIKVFANIVNGLFFDKVWVFDAHSDVAPALLHNCHNLTNHQMVAYFISQLNLKDFVLVSPDLGAYKKVDKLAQKINYKSEIATGIKVRDLLTGQIIKSDVLCNDLSGRTCLVIDDICDGGRTFIEVAKALKEKNAGKLILMVSHGIFSHDALNRLHAEGYSHVCSSDSIEVRNVSDFHLQYNVFQQELI